MTKAEMSELLEECMLEAYEHNKDKFDDTINFAAGKGKSAMAAAIAVEAAKVAAFGTVTALSKAGFLSLDED